MKKKIISLNIEGTKHLDTVINLLKDIDPYVVCMMEVPKNEVLKLAGDKYAYAVFAPNDVLGNIRGLSGMTETGVSILSKEVMIDVEIEYFGEKYRKEITNSDLGSHVPVMLSARIGDLKLGALHFTWTKNGVVDDIQRKHVKLLTEKMKKIGQVVLCGDFNIPRGNEMYIEIAKYMKDNIPNSIVSTLDEHLHYANQSMSGKLKLVVDYVWTSLHKQGTPNYQIENLEVKSGVSDHCALVFDVDLF